MARKIFCILWVTVWPAVAIIPPLINAQVPGLKQAAPTIQTAGSVDDQVPAESAANDTAVELRQTVDDSPTETPQRTIAQPAALEELPQDPMETLDPTERPVSSTDKPGETAKPVNELLPSTTGQRQRGTPPGFPATFPRQSAAAPRLNRGTGPLLTAQEEQAQKLIHERAALRGMQRQLRLETKYRSRLVQNSPVQTTRWQPQMVETNWVAGHRAAKP